MRFAVEKDGSIIVRKYKPGDWERKVELAYNMAKFWMENIRVGKEIEKLLADANDTKEKIRRLEKRARERPHEANNWSALVPLYFDMGQFKDAENAAVNAVKASPGQSASHFVLGRIYFIALLNAKRMKAGAANEKFISQYGARLEGLTPQALGHDYQETWRLAERHLSEALKLAPPKDSLSRKVIQKELTNLKIIDEAPFPKENAESQLRFLDEIMNIQEPKEAVRRLEEIVGKTPNLTPAWIALSGKYLEVGRAKEAEKAAHTAVNLEPDNPICHFHLSTIYYGALANSKATMFPEGLTAIIETGLTQQVHRKEPSLLQPAEEEWMKKVTLQALDCTYERAYRMVKEHAKEAFRLSKDKELRRAANDQLINLKLMDEM
jgi:cytochrome c-type biogenesis protein CcmH/NrfG